MKNEDIISVDEAAEMLGFSAQKVRVLMRRGKLPIGNVLQNDKRCKYVCHKHLVIEMIEGSRVI